MNYLGIIPARYQSSRFPGKPLALIGGKPMIQRVYEQASKVLEQVVVATDDERIRDCVTAFGGQVVMTRKDHRCGTERCLEAWQKTADSMLAKHGEKTPTVIINIQGDEPFIQPAQIHALMQCFEGEEGRITQIATLVKPYTSADSWEDLANPNTPKVAVAWGDTNIGTALLFSRSIIPYLRGIPQEEWLQKGLHYRHIGMYAYRSEVLPKVIQLPPSQLEQAESLEQLRWLEKGYTIRVARCDTASIGIDTPEDLEKAERWLRQTNVSTKLG